MVLRAAPVPEITWSHDEFIMSGHIAAAQGGGVGRVAALVAIGQTAPLIKVAVSLLIIAGSGYT